MNVWLSICKWRLSNEGYSYYHLIWTLPLACWVQLTLGAWTPCLSSRKTNVQWWIQNDLEKEGVEGLSCCSWQSPLPLPSPPLLLHPFSWGWLVGSWHPRGPAPSSSPASSSGALESDPWCPYRFYEDAWGQEEKMSCPGTLSEGLLPSELQPGMIRS